MCFSRNYASDDQDCEGDLSHIASYVAYKDDFCFDASIKTYYSSNNTWGYIRTNFSMSYSVDANGDVIHNSYAWLGCLETASDTETFTTDSCVDPASPVTSDAKSIRTITSGNHVQEEVEQKISAALLKRKQAAGLAPVAKKSTTVKSVQHKMKVEEQNTTSSSSYYYYYTDARFQLFVGYTETSYEWMVFSAPPTIAPTRAPSLAPTLSIAPSNTAYPTVAAGWTSEKWYAGNKAIIVSGRRTDYCLPFYLDREVVFNYVNHCGGSEYCAVLMRCSANYFV